MVVVRGVAGWVKVASRRMALFKQGWEVAVVRYGGQRLLEVSDGLPGGVCVGVVPLMPSLMGEHVIRDRSKGSSFDGCVVSASCLSPYSIGSSFGEQLLRLLLGEAPLRGGGVIPVDVSSVDVGCHSDCAFTLSVGDVRDDVQRLLDVAERSLYLCVVQAMPGNRIGDIGHTIQSFVKPNKFGIAREYVGHGYGRFHHEPSSVPNFGVPCKGHLIEPGRVIAIEPMVTIGSSTAKRLDGGWTFVAKDPSLAAYFEHSVAVTPRGPEILTALPGTVPAYA